MLLRLLLAVAYLAAWAGYDFYSADLSTPSPPAGVIEVAFLLSSVGLGFAIAKWWAPVVVVGYLPVLAVPGAYGGGQPDYSNGVAVALLVLPAAALLIAIGVGAGRLLRPRHHRL